MLTSAKVKPADEQSSLCELGTKELEVFLVKELYE
jgi:hypothetical protein